MKDQNLRVLWPMVDGRRTRCRVVPAAPHPAAETPPHLPLILLHGLGCSSDAWLPSLRVLAGRGLVCPTYAPDMPGYGCTRCAKSALDMDELADWTVRLMDVQGTDRAYVGGNSMGCQVALSLARRCPERVAGLILLGSTTGHSQVPFWRYALGLLGDGIGESPIYNWKLLGMYAQMGLRRYLATVQHMMHDDPLAHAGEVRAPVLVTRGGNDRIVPEAAAKELAAALPRGEYQALDHTAHAAEYNTPELFVSATLEFIARVEATAPAPTANALPAAPAG